MRITYILGFYRGKGYYQLNGKCLGGYVDLQGEFEG